MEIIERDCRSILKVILKEKVIGIFLETDDFFFCLGKLTMFHAKIVGKDSNEFGICRFASGGINTITK